MPIWKKEQIADAFQSLAWRTAEDVLAEVSAQNALPLLFRGHQVLDPMPPADAADNRVVHASPHFGIAASPKFGLGFNYHDFPRNGAFVSVFSSQPDQKLYPDDTLELVISGRLPDQGVPMGTLTAFDRIRHFEIGLTERNQYLGTFVYQHRGPIGGPERLLAPLGPEGDLFTRMLMDNAKSTEVKPGLGAIPIQRPASSPGTTRKP